MLFNSEKDQAYRKRLKKQMQKGVSYDRVSRRAIGLFPAPMTNSNILLQSASFSGYCNLLLALEANQQSGCMIIQSEANSSRSGILIFRGRILGCMYGQKDSRRYEFGSAAFERVLTVLQSSNKKIDAYGLEEELIIAASALFHGEILERSNSAALNFFDDAWAKLSQSNMPGCIVVTDKTDGSTFTIYVFSGNIVGIYYSEEGWLEPDISSVQKRINQNENLRVQSCYIPCHSVVDVFQYSFSLSGLADRKFSQEQMVAETHEIPRLVKLHRRGQAKQAKQRAISPESVRLNRFVPQMNNSFSGFVSRLNLEDYTRQFRVIP